MKLLEGKTVIVTGANRGIGRAIAQKCAEEGANVAFTDLFYDDNAKSLEAELSKLGVKCKGYASDASNFEDTDKVIKQIIEDFDSIDALVNNAGITKDTLLMRMTEEVWDQVISINLKSCYNTVKALSPVFMKQRSGSIINMSSIVGVKGNAGQANYSASKAGIIGFTKSIALELGSRGIRSNAIAPGFIETEMTAKLDENTLKAWRDAIPLKRGGTPEDVADCVVFLASDMSSYISGQVIQVDGALLT